jgi:hypothetical protein
MIEGMPIKLYPGQVSIPINGLAQYGDESQLRNPFGGGMWIDSIAFSRQAIPPGVQQRAILDVQFKIGPHFLMKDFVPIHVLCPPEDSKSQPFDQNYTWKLPKPLFVPEGWALSPKFQSRGAASGSSNAATLRMLYTGRQHVGPAPARVDVPWVASWTGATRTGSTDTRDQSSQADLVNPHDVPLHIERFTGRIYNSDGTCIYDNGESATSFTGQIPALTRYSLLRMIASDGKIIIRDRTPWASIFNLADMTWWAKSILGPKEWIIAYLDELLSGVTYPTTADYIPNIVMVGHREVAL